MLTDEQIAEYEAAHKRVARVRDKNDAWEVVLRKPSRAEYKQFRAMAHNSAQVADANELLVRKCCVFPAREAFDLLLEDWPGIPEACGEAIRSLCGLSAADDVK